MCKNSKLSENGEGSFKILHLSMPKQSLQWQLLRYLYCLGANSILQLDCPLLHCCFLYHTKDYCKFNELVNRPTVVIKLPEGVTVKFSSVISRWLVQNLVHVASESFVSYPGSQLSSSCVPGTEDRRTAMIRVRSIATTVVFLLSMQWCCFGQATPGTYLCN